MCTKIRPFNVVRSLVRKAWTCKAGLFWCIGVVLTRCPPYASNESYRCRFDLDTGLLGERPVSCQPVREYFTNNIYQTDANNDTCVISWNCPQEPAFDELCLNGSTGGRLFNGCHGQPEPFKTAPDAIVFCFTMMCFRNIAIAYWRVIQITANCACLYVSSDC